MPLAWSPPIWENVLFLLGIIAMLIMIVLTMKIIKNVMMMFVIAMLIIFRAVVTITLATNDY